MQKFVLLNMPVALAIASSWTDYITLPLSGGMTMFWWSPDPTFLDLSPVVLMFPPHNNRDFTAGLQVSADAGAVVSAIVSQDLAVLAPSVESFVNNVHLPINQMNAMLLDQKNSGGTLTPGLDASCFDVIGYRAILSLDSR